MLVADVDSLRTTGRERQVSGDRGAGQGSGQQGRGGSGRTDHGCVEDGCCCRRSESRCWRAASGGGGGTTEGQRRHPTAGEAGEARQAPRVEGTSTLAAPYVPVSLSLFPLPDSSLLATREQSSIDRVCRSAPALATSSSHSHTLAPSLPASGGQSLTERHTQITDLPDTLLAIAGDIVISGSRCLALSLSTSHSHAPRDASDVMLFSHHPPLSLSRRPTHPSSSH